MNGNFYCYFTETMPYFTLMLPSPLNTIGFLSDNETLISLLHILTVPGCIRRPDKSFSTFCCQYEKDRFYCRKSDNIALENAAPDNERKVFSGILPMNHSGGFGSKSRLKFHRWTALTGTRSHFLPSASIYYQIWYLLPLHLVFHNVLSFSMLLYWLKNYHDRQFHIGLPDSCYLRDHPMSHQCDTNQIQFSQDSTYGSFKRSWYISQKFQLSLKEAYMLQNSLAIRPLFQQRTHPRLSVGNPCIYPQKEIPIFFPFHSNPSKEHEFSDFQPFHTGGTNNIG